MPCLCSKLQGPVDRCDKARDAVKGSLLLLDGLGPGLATLAHAPNPYASALNCCSRDHTVMKQFLAGLVAKGTFLAHDTRFKV